MSGRQAIALGTLTVGVLDIADAFLFFWIRSGVPPARILQSIAAGLIGREAARAGGTSTAMLGLLLHFLIAFVVVLTFYVASRYFRVLTTRTVVSGLLYGLAVYVVMNFVVIPLSAIGARGAMPAPVVMNGLLIHAFGVGLPAAVFAGRARAESSSAPATLRHHSRTRRGVSEAK